MPPATRAGRGVVAFEALGRSIVRHPWRYIALWLAVFVVTLPFLPMLGSVTTNSTTTLPSNAPSSVAQAEFDRLFPSQAAGGASSYLLFTGPNLTGRMAQGTIENVTRAVAQDPSLTDIASVQSVYTQYASYLAGQVVLSAEAIQSALGTAPPLPVAVNESAQLFWGVPAAYVATWQALVANGTPAPRANVLAESSTAHRFANDSAALLVLGAFYDGAPTPGTGFNGSLDCAADPSTVVACADRAARQNEPAVVGQIAPPGTGALVANTALATLALENFTAAASQRGTATAVLSVLVGLPAPFLGTVWDDYPTRVPTLAEAHAWANATVANATLADEPIPVPLSIASGYVAASGTAQIVIVSFTVSDGYTNASGGSPVYHDIDLIDSLVPPIVRASAVPVGSIAFVQTGPAPLDQAEQTVINEAIALVLPITVVVLLLVTALYFRSPVTPLAAFAGLAVALVVGLGGTVLLGTLVTHVDTTSITLEEVFVLGVGTDYAIFLISRYREERLAGVPSPEAVVVSVSWAGQSVATSGTTAVIATLALTFSGVALLSQWGLVLSFAVLATVLLSLTMVPAILALAGPRVFWPMAGRRFERAAALQAARLEAKTTYFHRVARLTRQRPYAILAVVLLLSVPLVAIALNVPISYDFYQQLPTSQSAVAGLHTLGSHFGEGFAFPTTALVSFAGPLLVGDQANATEFRDLANLTAIASATGGVASVESLVGPYGGPLGAWLNLSSAPIAVRTNLEGLARSFIGNDGRTVLLVVVSNVSGLSASAISVVDSLGQRIDRYAADHPAVQGAAFLGGAPVTRDLATQASLATQRLILAVAIALLVVLFVVLRSWLLPLLAVATIGLSIAWAWALTDLTLTAGFGLPIFFFVPTLMFILILGLGIDYNIFLLTRVREERVKARSTAEATEQALSRTGGIITAAAVILAGAFATLLVGDFVLLVAIGFSVAVAVLLDAMVVRTYLVPSILQILGDRAWNLRRRAPAPAPAPGEDGEARGPPEPVPRP
ncbi:MAG: MMPL family transporter [Thermoplasmata archaeon]